MESFSRGLSVIRAFGGDRGQLSGADVAAITGLSRAAARRCLHTLSVLGYAVGRNGRYELTPAVLLLGQSYLGSSSIARVAQPVLERLAGRVQEAVGVAVLDGDEIVFVARAAARRILSVEVSVGTRLPAAYTASGRLLLACGDERARERFLAGVRLAPHTPRSIADRLRLREEIAGVCGRGYAIVDEELEIGLRSLAVPIQAPDGLVLAAINVGVQAGRVDRQALERDLLPVLKAGAREIGQALRPATSPR